jgi:hypothetical protein
VLQPVGRFENGVLPSINTKNFTGMGFRSSAGDELLSNIRRGDKRMLGFMRSSERKNIVLQFSIGGQTPLNVQSF